MTPLVLNNRALLCIVHKLHFNFSMCVLNKQMYYIIELSVCPSVHPSTLAILFTQQLLNCLESLKET